MFSKEVLIDSLTVVKEKALIGVIQHECVGICKNWSLLIESDFGYDLVQKFSKGWGSFSGCQTYPVEEDESCDLWEGRQLELRLSLIDHILKCLREVDQEWLDKLYKEVY